MDAAAQPGWGEGWRDQQAWVLEQGLLFWDAFATRFGELWHEERRGEAHVERVLGDASGDALTAFLAGIERDALGFAGAKMARRIVGLAGVADLARIEPVSARVACERRALRVAGRLIKEGGRIGTVAAATDIARNQFGETP